VQKLALEDFPEILTVQDLAKILRVGIRTAYRTCHRQDFPAIRVGKQIRVSKNALNKWLQSQYTK